MRPLDNIRVVDVSRVVSGPYCTMMLADMGAEVIKIEEPGRGDEARAFGPPFLGGESPYYLSINRNKKSCTVNLKTEGGRAILERLIERSDVLVENFRPGTMDRLGFGYATASRWQPRLVYCSISGFGTTGPDAGRPGYDLIVQGESGIMDITGQPDGPPNRVGVSIADLASGLLATQGILLALYARERTGRGQRVEIAMLDAMASLLTYNAGIYFATGESPTRQGNRHPLVVPYETMRVADGWLNLGVANDSLWKRFCQAIERPDLAADDRYATAAKRVERREELAATIGDILATRTVDDWMALLGGAGVPCGRIRTVAEVCSNPQLTSRGRIAELAHPTAGTVKMIGPPIELSDTPGGVDAPPPLLGADTDDVLTRTLRYTVAEVQAFRAAGAI